MNVTVLQEAGYEWAKYGFSLSFKDRKLTREEWWTPERSAHYDGVVLKQAHRDGGHNKFLEHIVVWLEVEASLEFWKQLDTYRVGISKQSESTMHTLDKRRIDPADFEGSPDDLEFLQYLDYLETLAARDKSERLPQGYLQRREVVTNYKTLRHIAMQRRGHKLGHWSTFIGQLISQLEHAELVIPAGWSEVEG